MSATCAALFYFSIFDATVGVTVIIALLCIFTNLVYMTSRIKAHLDDTVYSLSCLFTNVLVVIIIGVIAFILAFFNAEPVFTWLFFPHKMLHIGFGHTKALSSLYLSGFYLVFAFLETFIMRQILKY